jgi:hypothetical protein
MLQIAYLGVSLLGSWLILRWALDKIDPNKNAKAAVSPAPLLAHTHLACRVLMV